MLSAIPHELQALDQWVIAGPDKVPHNPRDGHRADVMDRATWGSFAEAIARGWPHVGFVLSPQDPYCIIDLDDPARTKGQPELDQAVIAKRVERYQRICQYFQTYIETSQSGQGLHIICRGSIPRGVRRDGVEIYSSGRYMICTGNVYQAMPIVDCQPLLDDMFRSMDDTPTAVDLVQVDGTMTDEEVFNMAQGAANADKFQLLWFGGWQEHYPSQSEADFALLSMLAYYSKDNAQVTRMFRWSCLGERAKAHRDDYIPRMLAKMRAKEPPQIDLTQLLNSNGQNTTNESLRPALPVLAQAPQSPTETLEVVSQPVAAKVEHYKPPTLPPGFIGECASYLYSSAIRPVPEIALAASIALLAGVTGRAFNISGSGLSQYIILLARTGSGKEGAARGIDSLFSAVRSRVPMVDDFAGPGAFASGQALIRVLDKQPCFISILGEFGLTLQALSDPNNNGAQLMLKKVLLDVYAKSGWSNMLRSSVYSDSEKNTKVVQAPNVTIFGESTPEVFYDGLDASAIAQGLIPRFSIFEYTGPRPQRNPHAFHAPPKELVEKFEYLAVTALTAQQNRVHCPVMVNPEAQAMLDAFDEYATAQINQNGGEVLSQLWNRAHLKALKLAALVAVGVNPNSPVVDVQAAAWACDLVQGDIRHILGRFAEGEVGQGDRRLEADMRRAIVDYTRMDSVQRAAYQVPALMLNDPVIPLSYLRKRLGNLISYKTDRRGIYGAIGATIKSLIETHELIQLAPLQVKQRYGTSMPLYTLPRP